MRGQDSGRRATAFALLAAALLLFVAAGRSRAEPIVLKMSFYTSDRSAVYQCQVKPFVDAVNAEGNGLVKIQVYFSGAIDPSQAAQPELVRSGAADLAVVVPGVTPSGFADSAVFGLPGLFRSNEEASLVYTRMIQADALEGYASFFVVGAYVLGGETINSRVPIATLADLKGQTIRVNNEIVAAIVRQLGATPAILPINRAMDALSQGQIDGVVVIPAVLSEFGFSRLTLYHYLLPIGAAPLAVVMNRGKLASLPPRAQEIIRKHSGDAFAKQVSGCTDAMNRDAVSQWRATPRRTVVDPSAADLSTARAAYDAAIRAWTTASPHNRDLMDKVTAELAVLRKNGNRTIEAPR